MPPLTNSLTDSRSCLSLPSPPPAARIDNYCLNDRQCVLGNKYSSCKWIIPRIYGKCRCPAGYVVRDGRCLPTLGKRCDGDEDCSAATADSFCKLPSSSASLSFRSSANKAKETVCDCKPGFKVSDNKMSCEPLPTPGTAANIT